jgi:hypothetical protein
VVNTARDCEVFARLVRALGPYLGEVVFVGGWAYRLFRLHELAQPVAFAPLMTKDADIATAPNIPGQPQTIRQLLKEAGFTEEPSGEYTPPGMHYRLSQDPNGFFVQFIAPLTGSPQKRDGTPDATVRIHGVVGEKLRYVDLLLIGPWTIRISESRGFPIGGRDIMVRIPNAATYLAHKMLVLPQRKRESRGKDVLYIHDTLLVFGGALEALNLVWRRDVVKRLNRRLATRIRDSVTELFAGVGDATMAATVEARGAGRELPAEDLVAVCRRGLSEVFAD